MAVGVQDPRLVAARLRSTPGALYTGGRDPGALSPADMARLRSQPGALYRGQQPTIPTANGGVSPGPGPQPVTPNMIPPGRGTPEQLLTSYLGGRQGAMHTGGQGMNPQTMDALRGLRSQPGALYAGTGMREGGNPMEYLRWLQGRGPQGTPDPNNPNKGAPQTYGAMPGAEQAALGSTPGAFRTGGAPGGDPRLMGRFVP